MVQHIFLWIGEENRTGYWVVRTLNDLKIPPPYGEAWAPKIVSELAKRKCYVGEGEYNANGRVPNPYRPLGDLTLGIKRTIVRPKPEGERQTFHVPALVSEECGKRANDNLKERGRGRGKQGKVIQALLRGCIFCPRCGKPMSVLQDKRGHVYYYCRAYYCRWLKDPCPYNRFVPGT